MAKNNILILFCLLNFFIVNSQTLLSKLKDFPAKSSKVFFSKDSPKSLGLNFSIKYPTSFNLSDAKNEFIVKGFMNLANGVSCMIGVSKNETEFSEEEKSNLLSENNLRNSVSNLAEFILYKPSLKISGMETAYIDYYGKVTEEINSFCRNYFIVYENYFISINFFVYQYPNATKTYTKKQFESYKAFFISMANTFKILK